MVRAASETTRDLWRASFYMLVGLLIAAASIGAARAQAESPTPQEYVDHVGGGAQIVPPGDLRLDGRKAQCGQRPTVLDNSLDDYGAAYPGFLILNPKLMNRVPTVVKLWIHAHECGHQFRGPDEETADCFAVQRGKRQGWLDEGGLDEVCRFIAPSKGSSMHFAGSHRCAAMKVCFADPQVR
jgi:hypothetical protein